MANPILRMQGICKSYGPGIVACDDASFSLDAGEIHALAGENGAGKTTLMKILFGMEKAQRGAIFIHGEEVFIHRPNDAMARGVGMVHQHFMLVGDLSVAENVTLGIEPRRRGLFDRSAARRLVAEMAEKYDMAVDPDALVRDLSVANRQKVEILKVLARNAEIIILDEPTAVLTPQETKRFFEQLSALRKAGRTIVVITHKLAEIKAICDRITILRKGRTVGTYAVAAISEAEISRRMIGGEPPAETARTAVAVGPGLLSCDRLTCLSPDGRVLLDDVSLELRGGEILGVVGVEGNGQRELVDVLTGRLLPERGKVLLAGTDIVGKTVGEIRRLGLAFIPEDRMADGVDLEGTILDNATAIVRDETAYNAGPFERRRRLSDYAGQLAKRYDVRFDALGEKIRQLSGGNMQKVVCGREIDACGSVLVADQPTRGVDVGAVRTIHDRIEALSVEGKAVLLVSSDLGEIRALCRRAIVLCRGEVVARIQDLASVTEEELGLYMLGLRRQTDAERAS
ncbi:MAG: ABC transporter ATP-binding protein [Candidatus Izemoplasmatales bacterium]